MNPEQPARGESGPEKKEPIALEKKESKFLAGLKHVGFKVWLAVMIIGGVLAFITALFLV